MHRVKDSPSLSISGRLNAEQRGDRRSDIDTIDRAGPQGRDVRAVGEENGLYLPVRRDVTVNAETYFIGTS